MRSLIAILCAAFLAAAAGASEQQVASITLRSTVLVEPGRALTLADIAVLRGPEAERLATTPIALAGYPADAAGWRKIDAQNVRLALDGHDPLWGTIQLRGGPCYVRTIAGETAQVTQVQPGPTAPHAPTPAFAGTVRHLAEQHIARAFRASPANVEVRWVSATEGLLDHTTAGAIAQIEDAGRSDRMALRITLYDNEAKVVIEGEAKADVRIRRDVAVLTRNMPRRRIIGEADVRIERQWADATLRLADPGSIVGREAATNLDAGAVVRESDVHSAVVIRRGERVQVRILTESITARLWARAMADGRPGETISFESLAPSRSDRLRFEARVEGAGSAVTVAGAMTR